MKRHLTLAFLLGAVGALIHVWVLTRIYGWNVPYQLILLGLFLGGQYAVGIFCWSSFVAQTKQSLIKKSLFAISLGLLICAIIGAMAWIVMPLMMILSILPQNFVMFSGIATKEPVEEPEKPTA